MKIAHFVLNTVNFNMITLCGLVIAPRDCEGARVGAAASEDTCPACLEKSDGAWVTFPNLS